MVLPKRGMVTDASAILNDESLSDSEKLEQIGLIVQSQQNEMDELIKVVQELRDLDVDKMLSRQLMMIQKTCTAYTLSIAELQSTTDSLKESLKETVKKTEVAELVAPILEKFTSLEEAHNLLSATKTELQAYSDNVATDAEEKREALKKFILGKFSELEPRFDAINQQFADLEPRFDAIDKEIAQLKFNDSVHDKQIVDVENRCTAHTNITADDIRRSITDEIIQRNKSESAIIEVIENNKKDNDNGHSAINAEIQALKDRATEDEAQTANLNEENLKAHEDLRGLIKTNEDNIAINASKISEHDEHLTEIESDRTAIHASLDEHKDSLNDHKGRIESIEAALPNITGDVSGITGRIEGVEGRTQTLEENADSLDKTVKSHSTTLENIQGVISNVENVSQDITQLRQTVYGVNNDTCDTSSILYRMNVFQSRADSLLLKMSEIPAINDFRMDFEKLKTAVGSENTINGIYPRLEAARAKIQEIEDTLAKKSEITALNNVEADLRQLVVDTKTELNGLIDGLKSEISDSLANDYLKKEEIESNYALISQIPSTDNFATKEDLVNTEVEAASKFAPMEHTHEGYAPVEHDHDDKYAIINHVHEEYAPKVHTHIGYAAENHNHDDKYATIEHNHDDKYAAIDHEHENYATHDEVSGQVGQLRDYCEETYAKNGETEEILENLNTRMNFVLRGDDETTIDEQLLKISSVSKTLGSKATVSALNVDIVKAVENGDKVFYESSLSGNKYVIESGEVPESIKVHFIDPENINEMAIMEVPDEAEVFIPKYVLCPDAEDPTKYRKYVVRTFAGSHNIQGLEHLEKINLDFCEYIAGVHNVLAGCVGLKNINFPHLLYIGKAHNFCAGCGELDEVVIPMVCQIEKFTGSGKYILQFLNSYVDGNPFAYDENDGYSLVPRTPAAETTFRNSIITALTEADPSFNINLNEEELTNALNDLQTFIANIAKLDDSTKRTQALSDLTDTLNAYTATSTAADLATTIKKVVALLVAKKEGESAWNDADFETTVNTNFVKKDDKLNITDGLDISSDAKKVKFVTTLMAAIKKFFDDQQYNNYVKDSNYKNDYLNAHLPSFPAHFLLSYQSEATKTIKSFAPFSVILTTQFAYETSTTSSNAIKPYAYLEDFETNETLKAGNPLNFRLMTVYDKDGEVIQPEDFENINIIDSKGDTITLKDVQMNTKTPKSFVPSATTTNATTPQEIFLKDLTLTYIDMADTWENKTLRNQKDEDVKDTDDNVIYIYEDEDKTTKKHGPKDEIVIYPPNTMTPEDATAAASDWKKYDTYAYDVYRTAEDYDCVMDKELIYIVQHDDTFHIFSAMKESLNTNADPTQKTKFTCNNKDYWYTFALNPADNTDKKGSFTVYDKETPEVADPPVITITTKSKEEYERYTSNKYSVLDCIINSHKNDTIWDKCLCWNYNCHLGAGTYDEDKLGTAAGWGMQRKSAPITEYMAKDTPGCIALRSCIKTINANPYITYVDAGSPEGHLENPDFDSVAAETPLETVTNTIADKATCDAEWGTLNTAVIAANNESEKATAIRAFLDTLYGGGNKQPGNYKYIVQLVPATNKVPVPTASSRLLCYYKDYEVQPADPGNNKPQYYVMKRWGHVIPDYSPDFQDKTLMYGTKTCYRLESTAGTKFTQNITYSNTAGNKSMSENGMLMNLLLGMGLLGWKTTVQSQFKDSSLLLKGFLGSKQVIDISLTEDLYNYYKTAQTKITSKNIKNGELRTLIELNYMIVKGIKCELTEVPENIAEQYEGFKSRKTVSKIFSEIKTYDGISTGYNGTKTFSDFLDSGVDSANYWEFYGMMLKKYEKSTDQVKRIMLLGLFVPFTSYTSIFTDQSNNILSANYWSMMKEIYPHIGGTDSETAKFNDYTTPFNGLIINGDIAGGLTYNGKDHTHLIPFGTSGWSASVAFPSETTNYSYIKKVIVSDAENGKKSVKVTFHVYDTTNTSWKEDEIVTKLLPLSVADCSSTSPGYYKTGSDLTNTGNVINADNKFIEIMAINEAEFTNEISMYYRRMQQWIDKMVTVFQGLGSSTIINQFRLDGYKLCDLPPFDWTKRTYSADEDKVIFHASSVNKFGVDSTIVQPEMALSMAKTVPVQSTVKALITALKGLNASNYADVLTALNGINATDADEAKELEVYDQEAAIRADFA